VEPTRDRIIALLDRATKAITDVPSSVWAFDLGPEGLTADADGFLRVGWLYDPHTHESWEAWWHPETDAGRLRKTR
jgi:hypothetical protein